MIAYDSDHTASFEDDATYDQALKDELSLLQNAIAKGLPNEVSVYCFYLPMASKETLVSAFDKKLGAYS